MTNKAKILIVEDEGIIAEDLQSSLKDSGYSVVGMVASGDAAIAEASTKDPDLVLMDIVLQGNMDGIQAAKKIRELYNIPIIYLTAYSDEKMLDRAKITEPSGYLLKPFRDRELHSTIEMALFKHELEMELKKREAWLSITLQSIGDAVVATDSQGMVKILNPKAASLTGHEEKKALGQPLNDVIRITDNKTDGPIPEMVNKMLRLRKPKSYFNRDIQLISKDDKHVDIEATAAPIIDSANNRLGTVLVFRDITELKEKEEELRKSKDELQAYSSSLEAMVRERTRDLEASQKELKKYSQSLEKTNEALKIIIQGIEEQKKEVEKKISHNLNLTVRPILDQLKSQEVTETVSFLLQSLEFNLTNMFSSFGVNLVKGGHSLTPREIRICEMIRSGLSSKQMAKVLGISPQTVLVHRKNIRKKLGLAKSRRNLASYLKASL
jgi:PAS domain S-box-containing protein